MPNPIIFLLDMILNLYWWVLFIYIIMSWLVSFGVINSYQPFIKAFFNILCRLVEPPMRWIRRYLPPAGGIDLSPIVLFIGIIFLQYTLRYYFW